MVREATTLQNDAPFPSLPSQILFYEVLSRLPANYLLKLRCVCRSWRALIDGDDHFVNTHLNRSKSSTRILLETRKELYFVGDDQFGRFAKGENGFSIRSSLDGLLCFESVLSPEPLRIANLSTGECASLAIHSWPQSKARICQLIRDPFSGRYKVLLVHWLVDRSFSEIFTLGKDSSWRELDIRFRVSGCWSLGVAVPCVGGALHWTNAGDSIVAFDIHNEKFRTLPLPGGYRATGGSSGCRRSTACLVEFDGFLHLIRFDLSSPSTMGIWVLKDYANTIWVKSYDLGGLSIPKEFVVDLISIIPVLVADGKVLLWVSSPCDEHQFLVFFSFRWKEFLFLGEKDLRLDGTIKGVCPYVSSLVSLKQFDTRNSRALQSDWQGQTCREC